LIAIAALTVVKGGKPGGNGFSEPAKQSRRPVMAAGTNAKTEARATARNAARGSKKSMSLLLRLAVVVAVYCVLLGNLRPARVG
jgi:hypothetical protein